jgi:hypothetical protein
MNVDEGILYADRPAFDSQMSELESIFCVDRQKWNFLWLTAPGVENGFSWVPKEYMEDVNHFMDRQTREMLRRAPWEFYMYFSELLARGVPKIVRNGHPDLPAFMEMRVMDAHETLYGLKHAGNVVFANFRQQH